MTAPQGERGPTGDHGQHGQQGPNGAAGAAGPAGVAGPAGPAGPTGPRGEVRWRFGVPTVAGPYVLTRVQSLALFIVVVVAFLSIAALQQRQANRIESNARMIAVQRWEQCVASVPFIQRFNSLNRHLLEIYSSDDVTNKKVAAQLREEYRGIIITPEPTVAQCGPRP